MVVNDSGPGARMAFGARPGAPAAPDPERAGLGSPARDALTNGDVVDLAAERRRSGVDQVLDALDAELVGLAPVKARIRQIAALLLVDSARTRFGLTTARPNLHMCFTGEPGTGKTTVALRMADLLKRLGHLERGGWSGSNIHRLRGQESVRHSVFSTGSDAAGGKSVRARV